MKRSRWAIASLALALAVAASPLAAWSAEGERPLALLPVKDKAIANIARQFYLRHWFFGDRFRQVPVALDKHVLYGRADIDRDDRPELFLLLNHPDYCTDWGCEFVILRQEGRRWLLLCEHVADARGIRLVEGDRHGWITVRGVGELEWRGERCYCPEPCQ